jgi:hypothetical protein
VFARRETASGSWPSRRGPGSAAPKGTEPRLLGEIDGVDASDQGAIEEAITEVGIGPELGEAAGRVAEYARTGCGFDPAAMSGG